MATPSTQQARSYHADLAETSAAAAAVIGALLAARAPWADVLTRFASYQYAAASISAATMAEWLGAGQLIDPKLFAGVSSAGYPISEPIVATIDRVATAPVEDLPAAWWDDAAAFMAAVEQLIASEVQDAARSAAQAEMVAQGHQNYVRMLVPPSCKRCVVLAGRIYRDLEAFDRHPGCDCVQIPVQDWDEAHTAGLVASPQEAYERGYIRDLTVAERKAIEDGADINTVINSSSGIFTADLYGRRVKSTRYGTTKRSAWRRRNPNRPVRLRPESIYAIAGDDRAEAVRLLQLYGYLT